MPFGSKVLKEISGVDTGDLVSIPGFPGYYATRDGRVFCLREMSQRLWPDGYYRVNLGGKAKGHPRVGVHQAVAMAMLPREPEQNVVRHLDGSRTNNAVENLAWGTVQENANDMVRHGRSRRGKNNNTTKLTEEQVLQIVQRYDAGESSPKLAEEFGVHRHTILLILNGQNWGWLTGRKHAS